MDITNIAAATNILLGLNRGDITCAAAETTYGLDIALGSMVRGRTVF